MRWAVAIMGLVSVAGCAGPAWMRLAERPGTEFPASFKQRLAGAPIDASDATDFAARRGHFLITNAKGEAGSAQLDALRPCSLQLAPALRKRARSSDVLAAAAAMQAMQSGQLPLRFGLPHIRASEPSWRAVGALSLGTAGRGNFRAQASGSSSQDDYAAWWRRRLLRDDHVSVRRAAALAAVAAASPHDFDVLLNVARRDPDERSRELAIEALAALKTERAALALYDIYRNADEPERLAVVAGWAGMLKASSLHGCSDANGEPACIAYQRLRRVVAEDQGLASMRASLAVLALAGDRGAAGATVSDAVALAEAWFFRRIVRGTTALRVAAIEQAPIQWPSLRKKIKAATEDSDSVVAAAAWERLSQTVPEQRTAAIAALRKLAESEGEAGQRALRALSLAGESSILPKLRAAAKSSSPEARFVAAARLSLLARSQRVPFNAAMAALTDKDAGVAARATCLFLNPAWAKEQALGLQLVQAKKAKKAKTVVKKPSPPRPKQ